MLLELVLTSIIHHCYVTVEGDLLELSNRIKKTLSRLNVKIEKNFPLQMQLSLYDADDRHEHILYNAHNGMKIDVSNRENWVASDHYVILLLGKNAYHDLLHLKMLYSPNLLEGLNREAVILLVLGVVREMSKERENLLDRWIVDEAPEVEEEEIIREERGKYKERWESDEEEELKEEEEKESKIEITKIEPKKEEIIKEEPKKNEEIIKEPKKEIVIIEQKPNYSNLTVQELRNLCKTKGLTFSRLKKDELIKKLNSH